MILECPSPRPLIGAHHHRIILKSSPFQSDIPESSSHPCPFQSEAQTGRGPGRGGPESGNWECSFSLGNYPRIILAVILELSSQTSSNYPRDSQSSSNYPRSHPRIILPSKIYPQIILAPLAAKTYILKSSSRPWRPWQWPPVPWFSHMTAFQWAHKSFAVFMYADVHGPSQTSLVRLVFAGDTTALEGGVSGSIRYRIACAI